MKRYGLYEDPTTHAFSMQEQNGGEWVKYGDSEELETLVEAWKFDAGRQTGFLRKAEAKLAGVEDVMRKLYTDIRELYTTDNYDGGDFRRWLWMLEELLEVPRDQR